MALFKCLNIPFSSKLLWQKLSRFLFQNKNFNINFCEVVNIFWCFNNIVSEHAATCTKNEWSEERSRPLFCTITWAIAPFHSFHWNIVIRSLNHRRRYFFFEGATWRWEPTVFGFTLEVIEEVIHPCLMYIWMFMKIFCDPLRVTKITKVFYLKSLELCCKALQKFSRKKLHWVECAKGYTSESFHITVFHKSNCFVVKWLIQIIWIFCSFYHSNYSSPIYSML